ncbi:MAG: hypothetical protein K2K80_08215 [Clostridia bacterium]|nr:hypothetical protein [Clostridia bacterium]
MKSNPKKKRIIVSIAVAAVIVAVSLSILITNIFVPVKYLISYCVKVDVNQSNVLRVSFVDVGFGDCTIVELPDGKTMLIDGGNGTHKNNLKVFKELNARGIDKIDYLVCSSVSAEHCGGLSEMLKYKKVENIYAPYCPATFINSEFRSFTEEAAKLGKIPEICEYGEGIFDDDAGYNFCFLSPSVHTLEDGEYQNLATEPTRENINAASAIIWIEYGGHGFLLTGNAPSKTIQKLFEGQSGAVEINGKTVDLSHCAVIKVPNHGSYSSAYADMYKLTFPQAAVLSVGKNGYGFPSVQAISDAQQSVGENFYRTDTDGTVTFTVKDAKMSVQKEKK